jgi:hypothetical protein
MRYVSRRHRSHRETMRFIRSRGPVLGLVVVFALIGSAEAAPSIAMPSVATGSGGALVAVAVADSDHASSTAVRAAASLSDRQRAAVRRLQVAARNLHRIVDEVVRAPNWLLEIQVLSNRADLILAIRNARAVGLNTLAARYQRVLDVETKRLERARSFSALLSDAAAYGEHVAQKAHDDNPNLSPTVLGNIAVNAANWYGNDALLKVTLRAAKQKSPRVYEITLKKGEDLDRRAYALFRALSVGARKTNRPYGGREGLHALPDAKGGFNGGLIGLRRKAESSSNSPAIDVNIDGKFIKIHVRHGV